MRRAGLAIALLLAGCGGAPPTPTGPGGPPVAAAAPPAPPHGPVWCLAYVGIPPPGGTPAQFAEGFTASLQLALEISIYPTRYPAGVSDDEARARCEVQATRTCATFRPRLASRECRFEIHRGQAAGWDGAAQIPVPR